MKLLAALTMAVAFLQTPTLFQIRTEVLPLPVAGEAYTAKLVAEGGTPPYHWGAKNLPPDLRLNSDTGVISGKLAIPEGFQVLVQVSDSATPPLTLTRLLMTAKQAPLEVKWLQSPTVNAGHLTGTVQATNHTTGPITLTVIAVAVNQTGKAFALRYENAALARNAHTAPLDFDVFMPPGAYTLNLDCVAEVPETGAIYRIHREIPDLTVPQPIQ
ncbi:MAG TPA: putative Ig domain-containing protein [Terriglobales bacterium]|nr:putative Ig domain-containing protein [Terriglobales bacterium]